MITRRRDGYCRLYLSLLMILTLNAVAVSQPVTPVQDTLKGLKDFYSEYFTMGVAVSPMSLMGDQASLILKHFGSLTAENVMKPGPLHPSEDKWSWENADRIVNFAQQNGLKVRGHVLVWHQQTAPWFFRDSEGKPVSKEVLLQRLKDHISAVVGRYKGKVYAWDVVNEAIDDSNDKFYRDSEWFRICGEDFIIKAFEFAHEADPEALLFYNDYNTEFPVKRDKIIKLVTSLREKGVPIHGIGLQGHWNIDHPTENELRDALSLYKATGLDIQITELDISVYRPSERDATDKEFTPEREQKQIEKYSMVFRVLREFGNSISGVTFWNISDRSSWLDNFPVRGRKNYPLLFDRDLKPKKAYYEVIDF